MKEPSCVRRCQSLSWSQAKWALAGEGSAMSCTCDGSGSFRSDALASMPCPKGGRRAAVQLWSVTRLQVDDWTCVGLGSKLGALVVAKMV